MKLASIQKIINIEPIEGADFLEKATVLGWQVVVKKGEFKVGEKAIYVQIDTIAPNKPEFEFLRERNFRIRTIKLRKTISQGLLLPLANSRAIQESVVEGQDMTEYLGIKKYEKPDNNPSVKLPQVPKSFFKKYIYLFKYKILYKLFPSLNKKSTTPFPSHLVSKTDEERIQNVPGHLNKYKGKDFIASYKLDGSSITIIHEKSFGKSKFRICSRNNELHDSKNDWQRVFDNTNFKEHVLKIVDYFKTNNVIVQGEAIGKFNGNHHNLKQDEIRLFNILVDGRRLNPAHFLATVNELNIPHCPIHSRLNLNFTMEEILKYAELPDILNPKVPAEGLVFRDVDGSVSFKVINNNFLLKKGE
jgi:hypothetical protein